MDLGQPGRRPAGHPAQVVADLHQPDGVRAEGAAQLDDRVPAALGLEVVARLGEPLAGRLVEPVDRAAAAKSAGALMPVPTAVPPRGSSRTRGRTASRRSRARSATAAYPPSSCPRVTGVASIRWVRPDFTASAYSALLALEGGVQRGDARRAGRGRRGPRRRGWPRGRCRWRTARRSRGRWGGRRRPAACARVAMTSLTFMFVLVPDPVWKTSIGNWSSCCPSTISPAARVIASACSVVRDPSSALVLRRGRLDPGQRVDERRLERLAADREVLDRALGLRLPPGVPRDPHLAHGVVLDPVVVGHVPESTQARCSQ